MLLVIKPFIGHGYDFAQPGTKIDPPEPHRSQLLEAGVAVEFETKILPGPDEVKKNELPASSQADPQPLKKTREKRTKSAKS